MKCKHVVKCNTLQLTSGCINQIFDILTLTYTDPRSASTILYNVAETMRIQRFMHSCYKAELETPTINTSMMYVHVHTCIDFTYTIHIDVLYFQLTCNTRTVKYYSTSALNE